jgi:ParB family chromosome partitioning protein
MDQKLGRGLTAILGSEFCETDKVPLVIIEAELIIPNKNQPRKHFDKDKLQELSQSIASYGLLQPLVVRKVDYEFELLAGERRLRAAKMAGLKELPVYIVQCSDKDVLAISLVENLQRDELNVVEEAEAFQRLIEEYQCTQESLAFMVSKSRSYIANAVRMLTLPDAVKRMVINGQLSSGHVKLLVGVVDAEKLAKEAVDHKMSVRMLEKFIQNRKKSFLKNRTNNSLDNYGSSDEDEIARRISGVLGLETRLKITANGSALTIYCATGEQLDGLARTLLAISENGSIPAAEWI